MATESALLLQSSAVQIAGSVLDNFKGDEVRTGACRENASVKPQVETIERGEAA